MEARIIPTAAERAEARTNDARRDAQMPYGRPPQVTSPRGTGQQHGPEEVPPDVVAWMRHLYASTSMRGQGAGYGFLIDDLAYTVQELRRELEESRG